MSQHDDRLVAESPRIREALTLLDGALDNEREATKDKKRAVAVLRRLGLSARFIGEKVGVSHVTILAWEREVDI